MSDHPSIDAGDEQGATGSSEGASKFRLFEQCENLTEEQKARAYEALDLMSQYRDPYDGLTVLYAESRKTRASRQVIPRRNCAPDHSIVEREFILRLNENSETELSLFGVVVLDGKATLLNFFAVSSDDKNTLLMSSISGKQVVVLCSNCCVPETTLTQLQLNADTVDLKFSPVADAAYRCLRNGNDALLLQGSSFHNRFVDATLWNRVLAGQIQVSSITTRHSASLFRYTLLNFHEGRELPLESIVVIDPQTSQAKRPRSRDPQYVLGLAKRGVELVMKTSETRKHMLDDLEVQSAGPTVSERDKMLQLALGGDEGALTRTGRVIPCREQIARRDISLKTAGYANLIWDETPCACDAEMPRGSGHLIKMMKTNRGRAGYAHDRKQRSQKEKRKVKASVKVG